MFEMNTYMTETILDETPETTRAVAPGRMKVLFIKPYWLWGSTNEASPPMGLLYLSSSLKNRFPGITVRLLDLRFEKKKAAALTEVLKTFEPDLVGILSLTGDFQIIRRISEIIKETASHAHVSCGGPYPTHCPEDFNDLIHVDSIVRGEGENSVCDLVSYLSGEIPVIGFEKRGIGVRRKDGSLPVPDHSPLAANLDSVPVPDWDLIDIGRYSRAIQTNAILGGKRYMPIVTSRGCPFHCIYCHAMFGKKVRFRSPESVVDEIETLVRRYKVDEIQIYDDIFNIDRERVTAICDLIAERHLKIRISFPNGVRGDMMDDELILKLKKAGAYMMTFAVETVSPRLQKLIRKNLDIEKTVKAIRFASKEGLITRGFFMVGFPTETFDEIKDTVRFPHHLPLSTISIFSVVPFKGTQLHELARSTMDRSVHERLAEPDPTYFAPRTYYSEATGISLRHQILMAYFLFFTPWRLLKYFMKIPRKDLYLKHIADILYMGFGSGKKNLE
jgi:radical SAM superfamily enzyme YgiQ (UPF0313 family)